MMLPNPAAIGHPAGCYVGALTFVQNYLLEEPRAPNRFRHSVSGYALHMIWEVENQGAWQMGDHLDCTPVR